MFLQWKTAVRYDKMVAKQAARSNSGGKAKSAAHLGRLVTVAPMDTSRMTAVQKKQWERNRMVERALSSILFLLR